MDYELTMAEIPRRIDFHYLKHPEYRSYHADGAVGSPTPKGGIHITFYLERSPIPLKTTHEVGEDGKVGRIIASEGKVGIIRELQLGVVMDLDCATAVRDWLSERISEIKKRNESSITEEKHAQLQ
jgi:hypothetical protein